MAGTGVGKFSSTAGSNTANMTVNFAENMAPSNVNNAARELMGHMRDMYEQLGDGYFEFGDGDGTYTVARSDADTITITSSADISSVYFAGRKIRITDGGANVVEGTIASSSHSSTTQTVNLTGISLASGTPTKVELGIDTAAFGGRVILDDDGDTYIEAVTDDTIDIYVAGAKDFVITANTFTAESGSSIVTPTLEVSSAITLPAGATNITTLDIDGATDIGAAIVDADLFIIDDGAGGTNRKVTASRLKTYAGATSSFTEAVTITTADNTDTLSLVSTDADANSGPNLRLYRNSSSPVNDDVTGVIQFEGRNNNSQDFISSEIKSVTSDVADGSEDGALALSVMNAGTLQQVAILTGPEVVFNETSNDIDFRVESNALTHAFFIDGGTDHVSIGNSSTSLYTLDIKQNADFTGSDSDTANEAPLRVTSTHSNGRGAIAVGGGNNNGVFNKGTNDLTIQGYNSVTFDVSTTNDDKFGTKTERFRISSSGKLATGAETDPDVDAGGLTLNHGANDGKILTFKNSDVAHSMTSIAEADTYGVIGKAGANDGGIQMVSMNDSGNVALQILGISNGGEDTGKGTGDHGCVRIDAASRSGTSLGTQGANANMVTICNNNTVRFIFDAEGDFHADSGSTTFDTYEDAQLVRAYDLSHGKGVIASKFDKFVQYNASDLTDAGLVGKVNNEYNEDGTKATPLINMSGFMRLHNGAIWQQYEKTERLANAMYELAKAAVGEDKANEILKQNEIKLLN